MWKIYHGLASIYCISAIILPSLTNIAIFETNSQYCDSLSTQLFDFFEILHLVIGELLQKWSIHLHIAQP